MATMNVSLPDKMKEWAEAQAETGRYGNVSDYVRDLIRKDQQAEAFRVEVQAAIEEGIASGISELSIDEVFERARMAGRK